MGFLKNSDYVIEIIRNKDKDTANYIFYGMIFVGIFILIQMTKNYLIKQLIGWINSENSIKRFMIGH
jgi:hydrogenase-4 membrane subunit HyfE